MPTDPFIREKFTKERLCSPVIHSVRNSQLAGSMASAGLRRIGLALGGFAMANWKTELDAFVKETMAFAKSLGAEPHMPLTIVEPNRMPPVNRVESEREEIRQRVADFRAQQQRFIMEREDSASSEWKRILASLRKTAGSPRF